MTSRYGEPEKYEEFGPTRTLARHATELRYERLPWEVVNQVKLVFLHGLSAALAAVQTELCRKYIDIAKDMGTGKREATILGEGSRLSCVHAAYANGSLWDAMDWEDTELCGHAGAVFFPTALAIGERVGASGKEFITSIVAAYDIGDRIELAMLPRKEIYEVLGFPVSQLKSFGAAAAACKLLGLDENQTAEAMGIAGTYSHPLTNANTLRHRPDSYHSIYGWASMAAILSAFQAQKGISGGYTILDDEKGFHRSIGYDRCNFELMTKWLGKEYRIMKIINLKRWPAENNCQSHLDVIDILLKKHGVKAQDIEQVNFSTALRLDMPLGYPDDIKPRTMVDAQFNIPYITAMRIRGVKPGPDWYRRENYENPEILNLAKKVKVKSFLAAWEHYIKNKWQYKWFDLTGEIVTKDGKRFSETVCEPKGHVNNPFTWDEIKDHFRGGASFTLKKEKVEKVIQLVQNLEKLDNISELVEVLHS